MKIIVIGAGAWGTALAVKAARQGGGHRVELWARDVAQAMALDRARENARYLPGIPLPRELTIRGGALPDLIADAGYADLLVAAMPVAGLRETLIALRGAGVPLAWLCKGFEPARDTGAARPFGLLPHEVQRQVAPELLAGVLSGPSFAQEVARGQPTALVAASAHASVRDALVAAFHGATLRIYANDDLVGVEVGGAVKNVLAIATGLADGMNLGLNARAALITRGLAEMTRLGLALGARPETFMGLSGLGDLVLTATGDLSRNRQVGLQLAAGKTLEQAVQSLGHVAEGVYCARTVLQRARHLGVDMPITECVVALLDGQLKPVEAVAALMGRDPKGELL
ncbi:MAG: NAD(P)-dependent glycerol-3-phosphate dehydrogenase [Burkholderiaceae bacterium]|uniref:NAD(P)H-dependent glycerol-3-phosphate dehydrogenase n=1 Tax=Ottowia sp. TaxID=1898956 RepID=UPI001D985ED2|nr:NAD(P)H-dependent glycerol-3-phosphate dehydrogenase [Ottowia sp.]MCB2032071.1 NAD(P)-dependent glycerol-3-phosphate dehydrogenase [Ottowia sp.]MCP5256968.1 NAD(P)-dependent glycerol-3-phosphate dehydrogenase [Burkholderiaceae bacterium]HRW71619.1 NAD(P)H-dependent glycerol-3-phosphate dehydrogenase [Ottowia sp.]